MSFLGIDLGTSGLRALLVDAKDAPIASVERGYETSSPQSGWSEQDPQLWTDALESAVSEKSPAELTSELGETLRPPSGLTFLPYLSGERTPHNDAMIRGSFIGLSGHTSRNDLTRGIFEGVAFGLRDGFEALKATGAEISNLIAIGGGARSVYWLKLIATVLGIPLHLPEKGEFGAALGAARLGLLAATGKPPSDVMTPPAITEVIQPDLSLRAEFEAAYQTFRKAYPAIRSIS